MPVFATAFSSTPGGQGAQRTIAIPAGTRAGDLLVVWCYSDQPGSSIFGDIPAGFTYVGTRVIGSTVDGMALYVGVRVATASEPATFDVFNSGSAPSGLIVLRGCKRSGIRAAHRVRNLSASSPWPMQSASMYVSEPSELLWFGASDPIGFGSTTREVPRGFTKVQELNDAYSQFAVGWRRVVRPGMVNIAPANTGTTTSAGSAVRLAAFPSMTAAQQRYGRPLPAASAPYTSATLGVRARSL